MGNGCRAGFKYFRFSGEERRSTAAVRGAAKGRLVVTDGERLAAQIPVTPSMKWKKASGRLRIRSGVRPLYFIFIGRGKMDFRSFTIE